jgi:hypothetical protein
VRYVWHPLHGREVIVRAHGTHGLVVCTPVGDADARGTIMPQWMLDEIACASTRVVVEPVTSIEALEELRQLLVDTHAMDAPTAALETSEPAAVAPVSSDVEQSSGAASPASRRHGRGRASAR